MSKIKDRITEVADYKGVKKMDFFKIIGASYSNFRGKSKESSPSSDIIAEISSVYPDINLKWLLTGEGEMIKEESKSVPKDSVQTYRLKTDCSVHNQEIPLYNIEASAGLVELFQDSNSHIPTETIKIPGLPKCDGAVRIRGDSMRPIIKTGDMVLYKEVHDIMNNIFWGEMYLISVDNEDDEYIAVKYIQKSDKGEQYITLASENKDHDDKDVLVSKVRALALVKASIRINST